MSFYSELKRRNVLRVAAGYIVAAWLLIQVAETIFPLFGFDDGPARIVVVVMIIGFLPALIVSWIFELTPSGLQKDKDVEHSQASVAISAKRSDRIIMLMLVLAVSYFAIDKFVLSESREQAIAEAAREEALVVALETLKNNKSIAVLPFADMSPNQDQEYFADGMTEELLNELAQLEGLNVTGRTSSFAFKGQNQDLRSIGEQLGVAYILEGSVRKQDDEVRITAQLINTRDGSHMWSDTYDARLDDIFYIQEDIARSVAGALSIALEVEGRNHLPGTGTDNVDAYNLFLEARAALNSRDGSDVAGALYQRAIDLDPEYAEAWAGLGLTFAYRSFRQPSEQARATQEQGRELVVRATEIDPALAMAHSMLGAYQWARGDWMGATEMHQKYTALAPADISASLGTSNIFGKTGRVREALRIRKIEFQNDPLSFVGFLILGELYIQASRYDDARAAFADADRIIPPPQQGTDLRRMFLAITLGEAEGIRLALADYAIADPRVESVVQAILGEFDSARNVVLEVMRRIFENDPGLTGEGRMVLASMAAHYGDAEFALEIMTDEFSVNMIRTNRLWYPYFSDMRKLPGFKTLAENIGFVAYWRKYGWADTCRPLGDDDFECS